MIDRSATWQVLGAALFSGACLGVSLAFIHFVGPSAFLFPPDACSAECSRLSPSVGATAGAIVTIGASLLLGGGLVAVAWRRAVAGEWAPVNPFLRDVDESRGEQ